MTERTEGCGVGAELHFVNRRQCVNIEGNKTRQGYARKRILKLAGYFFAGCAE